MGKRIETLQVAATALALFVSSGAAAQKPQFGERIEVKLIEIDVIVTDRAGNRIYGLTADDFEIFEGRSRQTITNFSEYQSPTAERSETTSPALSTPEARTLLVLVDWIPREGFVRSSVFDNLETLVSRAMREGDRAGIVFWDPGLQRPTTLVEPSSDHAAVTRAIRRLAATVTTDEPRTDEELAERLSERAMREQNARGARLDIAGQEASTRRLAGERELMSLRRKIAAMKHLIASLAAGRGKKSVLYVSNRFALPVDPSARLSAIAMVGELAKTANAGGVTFYAVRPVVPESGADADFNRHLDALSRLTEPTGGLLDFGRRSVETVGARLVDDLESYYSIAYRARSDGRDRERRITVRPKNREYRVRARESFVEKSNETMARDSLVARLFSEQDSGEIRFDIDQGAPRRTGRDRWLLPIVLRIPADQLQFATESGDNVARVKILIVAGNGIAEVTKINEDDLRVVAGKNTEGGFVRYSVEILNDRRGSEVAIGVMDRRSGLVGTRTIDLREKASKLFQ